MFYQIVIILARNLHVSILGFNFNLLNSKGGKMMKKGLVILTSVLFVLGLSVSGAMAINLGTNITISDENTGSRYWDDERNGEDNEVEPGMVGDQKWDLEGFFLKDKELSIVGGYDFVEGEDGNGTDHWDSGDLFIDVTGDAVFGDIHGPLGDGNHDVLNTFGYDYVLDLNYDYDEELWNYDVFAIDNTAIVTTAYYQQNQGSSPWRYDSGGEAVLDADGYAIRGSASYGTYGDSDVGFLGGDHNVIQGIDLSFLGDDINKFTASFTMGCGNDHLVGDPGNQPVPEPSTIILLGLGILGLVGFRKKFAK